MTIDVILFVALGLIIFLLVLVAVLKFKPKKIKVDDFNVKWKSLQGYCRDKSTWAMAILDADKLLEDALKKKRFKGKSMGEKLVAAQRLFTDNDAVWFAHNLSKKLTDKPSTKLKEQDVKTALVGFRQALKDVGALPVGDVKNGK